MNYEPQAPSSTVEEAGHFAIRVKRCNECRETNPVPAVNSSGPVEGAIMQSGEVMQGGEVALEPNVCSCQHSQQQAARVSQAYQHYVARHYWLGQLYQRFMAGRALLPPAMGLGVQQFSCLSEAFGGPMPVASVPKQKTQFSKQNSKFKML